MNKKFMNQPLSRPLTPREKGIRTKYGTLFIFAALCAITLGVLYSNQEIQSFLKDKNIAKYVSAIMQRIYLLRNQLIHGGATHQGRMNRVQVEDCKTLVMKLLPCMISIMMKYPKKNWGELCYPPLY